MVGWVVVVLSPSAMAEAPAASSWLHGIESPLGSHKEVANLHHIGSRVAGSEPVVLAPPSPQIVVVGALIRSLPVIVVVVVPWLLVRLMRVA